MNRNTLITFLNPKDKEKNLKLSEKERGKLNPTCYLQKNDGQLTLDITGNKKSGTFKVLRESYFKSIVLPFWQL